MRFPIKTDNIDDIRTRLDTEPNLDRHDREATWAWLPCAVDDIPEGGVSLLGEIRILATTVELSVNSTVRAQTGEQYLSGLLGELVGQPLTLHQSVESALDRYQSDSKVSVSSIAPEEYDIDTSQRMKDFLDQHYRETLDEPVPMLGNKSPRECAESADRSMREQVIHWLKVLENQSLNHRSQTVLDYDFGWIWRELNLDRE